MQQTAAWSNFGKSMDINHFPFWGKKKKKWEKSHTAQKSPSQLPRFQLWRQAEMTPKTKINSFLSKEKGIKYSQQTFDRFQTFSLSLFHSYLNP